MYIKELAWYLACHLMILRKYMLWQPHNAMQMWTFAQYYWMAKVPGYSNYVHYMYLDIV